VALGLAAVSPVNGKMTERELQASIRRVAREYGWMEHCAWLSIRSPKGWPDLTLAKGLRLVIAELKAENGVVTPEQEAWLDWWRTFSAAVNVELRQPRMTDSRQTPHIEVYVWRPSDLEEAYRVLITA
jgi:hypothetical protein